MEYLLLRVQSKLTDKCVNARPSRCTLIHLCHDVHYFPGSHCHQSPNNQCEHSPIFIKLLLGKSNDLLTTISYLRHSMFEGFSLLKAKDNLLSYMCKISSALVRYWETAPELFNQEIPNDLQFLFNIPSIHQSIDQPTNPSDHQSINLATSRLS